MDHVNKTLYIPLYGKAYVSRKGLFLHDPMAEAIWKREGFALKGKSKSKWLAYNMGMRSAVFDRWVKDQIQNMPEASVVHIGCGLDSRAARIRQETRLWFDLDFPEVIAERQRYFPQTQYYRMIATDVRDTAWMEHVPRDRPVILVMEGVSMYLTPGELKSLMGQLKGCFPKFSLLMDCYSTFAARVSKYKNPINDVGVRQVYGLDDPNEIGLRFVREHDLTPDHFVEMLTGLEKRIFKYLFAGRFAKKIYKLYEFAA